MTAGRTAGFPLTVVIEGSDLPGLSCRPDPGGRGYHRVHVGVCTKTGKRSGVEPIPGRPWGVTGLVPGDAKSARWELEIEARPGGDRFDFAGPYVRGNRGDRHVGLAWGDVDQDGTFGLFRGAKLSLDSVDPALIRAAAVPGCALVARVGLTDANGNPRCATLRPPHLTWTAESR